jgi:hypothetical protein
MTSKAHAHLAALGFSDYEIKAYVTLLAKGAMNGYQLAKASGIPRPNIYTVLERLERRGAVAGSSVDGVAEYHALPAEEMLNRLAHSFHSDVALAKSSLKDLNADEDHPLAWNLRGYDAVISKADSMIRAAKGHVLIGLWPQEAGRLSAALSAALAADVRPTVLCLHGCEQDCGGCAGRIYRYPIGPGESTGRSLVLTTDGDQTLVAQFGEDGSAVAAHSSTEVLATVANQYVLNAIAVAEIVRSLGPRMLSIIDPEAMTALRAAGLAVGQTSWFDRLCGALAKSPKKKGRKES